MKGFDYNNDDEHRIVMLQGDRRHAGTPEDGVISREQIAQVLVTALSNDAAKNKTFELVAERGEAQQDLTPLFAELRNDNPQKNDGVFDIDNMPLTEEPECVINDLNLYSKNSKISTLSYDSQSYDSLELYIYRSRRRKLFPIFVNFQIYRLKQVSDMKALLITALFMEFISVNTASAAEEIHHADSKVDDQVLIAK